ncbi:Endonuclease/exonuclease/phosphatase, partial [Infundibulicybe gibba]
MNTRGRNTPAQQPGPLVAQSRQADQSRQHANQDTPTSAHNPPNRNPHNHGERQGEIPQAGNPPPPRRDNPTPTPWPPNQTTKRKGTAIKIATLNIKGGGSETTHDKWQHVNQVLRDQKIDILSIQETHLSEDRLRNIHTQFERRVHIIHSYDPDNVNTKGVAIILNKQSTKWREASSLDLIPGRALMVTLPWNGNQLKILAIYAPNNPRENADLWPEIQGKLEEYNHGKPDIMLGDFNMVEESLDRLPPHADSSRQTESLQELKQSLGHIDGWRRENPHRLGYTYRQGNTGIQSRIDRIYITNTLLYRSCEWNIQAAPLNTDHRMATMKILDLDTPYVGRGRWSIPLFIIKDKEIINQIAEKGIKLADKIERIKYSRTAHQNPQTLFKTFKDEIVVLTRKHARSAIPKIKKSIDKLEEDLDQTLNEEGACVEAKQMRAALLDERIRHLKNIQHMRTRDNLATKNQIEGETLGKYWIKMN